MNSFICFSSMRISWPGQVGGWRGGREGWGWVPLLHGDARHVSPAASEVLAVPGRAARACAPHGGKRTFKGMSFGKGAVIPWLWL